MQPECSTRLYGTRYQPLSATDLPDTALRAILADQRKLPQLSTTKRWLQKSSPCMSVFVRINLM